MEYAYNEITCSLKKERNYVICCNMDKLGGYYTNCQSLKDKQFVIPLTWGTLIQNQRRKVEW